MLREGIPEKELDDDNGNMVAIAIAPNPLDRRLSRKRKCDSKAANDGGEEHCLKRRESPMASSNKGVRGQPAGGVSKKTKSNIQPKVGLAFVAEQFMTRQGVGTEEACLLRVGSWDVCIFWRHAGNALSNRDALTRHL